MAEIYAKQREISDMNRLPKSLRSGVDIPCKRTVNRTYDKIAEDTKKDTLSPTQKSRLHIPRAIFSSTSVPNNVGGKKQKSLKRIGKKKRRVRSIKFIVPSRKKILNHTKDVENVNQAVYKMNKNALAKILSQNQIIKHDSKAPVGLMQNIAKSVFTM